MIKAEKEKLSLRLELDDGVVNGKEKIKRKSYNQVNPTATDEDIHSVGKTLSSLQSRELVKIKKLEETILSEEE